MADNQWLLKEDGYLNVNTEATNIIYHSNLYVVLVFTRNNEVKVLDINSGVVLHSCRLAAGTVVFFFIHIQFLICQIKRNKYDVRHN